MEKILNFLINVVRWVLVSSNNAQKYSLSVKFALLGIIPFVMQGIGITCGLNLVCPSVSANELEAAASALSNVVFLFLTLVSSIGTAYAVVRKIVLSFTGKNAAFANSRE